MEREYLERCLADGMSLKAIGEATGKHFATVSYWLKKHGLEPNGKAFAPKGPLPAEELQALLEREMTMLEIARHLGTGVTQVRYWVRKHGLEPARVTRRRKIRHAREEGSDEVELLCRSHGLARFK